jgi:hypothetical protein
MRGACLSVVSMTVDDGLDHGLKRGDRRPKSELSIWNGWTLNNLSPDVYTKELVEIILSWRD